MLITSKSLVFHEIPARVCCGGVLWVRVPSGVVGCGSVWLLHVSLCVCCISRLRFKDIFGMAEVDEQRVCIKFCVRLGKTGSETFEMLKQALVIRAWAVAELLSGLDFSRMTELRSGRPSTATSPSKVAQVGRLSTRIVVVPYTISVQRLELVMDLDSEFSQNSWTCIGLQRSLCRECWPWIRKTVE